MSLHRCLVVPIIGAGLLVAAACGDVNADLESNSTMGTPGDVDGSAMVLSRVLPAACPLAPPVPRYLADGGVVPDLEAVFDGGSDLQVPDICSATTTCEYGASADRQCNRAFTCQNGEWAESRNVTCYAGSCPAAGTLLADLDGRPCALAPDGGAGGPEAEAICNVAGGVCACTTGSSGLDVHDRRWACSGPLIRSCPLARPLIGSHCAGDAYCDFGACKAKRGIAMACLGQYWQVVPPTCAK